MSQSPISQLWRRLQQVAHALSIAGLFVIFAVFIYGVALRYLGHPQSWVDEVVTILSTWVVFFTSAFVLRWSEFIAFDMLFRALPDAAKRVSLVLVSVAFIAVFGAVFYQIVDYVLFMKIMTTDMTLIRLDYIYSIFAVFLAAISIRLAVLAWRLTFGDHEAALAELSGIDPTDEVAL